MTYSVMVSSSNPQVLAAEHDTEHDNVFETKYIDTIRLSFRSNINESALLSPLLRMLARRAARRREHTKINPKPSNE